MTKESRQDLTESLGLYKRQKDSPTYLRTGDYAAWHVSICRNTLSFTIRRGFY